MLLSAAIAEAFRRGAEVFPICAIEWTVKGLSLGRGVYSPAVRHTDLGQVTQVTDPGGWGEIVYGSGISKSGIDVVRTTVVVLDPAGELRSMLDTYEPRGSATRIDWAAPGLLSTDWEPLFTGVVEDWAFDGLKVTLTLKTDDTALRTPVPLGAFRQAEWGSAADGTIFGTHFPLVLGIHDSWQITARGAVPCVNVRYDKDLGYWWQVSADRMVSIDRVYFDGVPQGESGWSVVSGVWGSAQMTLIAFAEGSQPEKEVIVSVDCHGPDELGGTTGDTLTGAPDQLRALIEEFAYRPPPLALWRGAHAIVEDALWNAVSEWFALHLIESARRLGADQTAVSMAEIIQSFLDAHPWVRVAWTQFGTLGIYIIDPDDADPDDDYHLALNLHHPDGVVPYTPGDQREVYSHVRMQYLWSAAEQKFMSAYEAHDVAALVEKVEMAYDNPWSQGRLVQADDLNPAPPADPEIPS
jgi:hypothetical protein